MNHNHSFKSIQSNLVRNALTRKKENAQVLADHQLKSQYHLAEHDNVLASLSPCKKELNIIGESQLQDTKPCASMHTCMHKNAQKHAHLNGARSTEICNENFQKKIRSLKNHWDLLEQRIKKSRYQKIVIQWHMLRK